MEATIGKEPGMANNGPARAWQFLKRNPDYRAGWRAAAPPAPLGPAPFPLRARSRADAAAAAWGLLAWADPDGGDELPSPFWADTPMVEAESAPPGAPCQSQPKIAHFCQSKIAHFGLGFVPPDAVLGVSDLM